jgi:hypothetical protein
MHIYAYISMYVHISIGRYSYSYAYIYIYIYICIYIPNHIRDEREQIRLQYQEIKRLKSLADLESKIVKKGLFDD